MNSLAVHVFVQYRKIMPLNFDSYMCLFHNVLLGCIYIDYMESVLISSENQREWYKESVITAFLAYVLEKAAFPTSGHIWHEVNADESGFLIATLTKDHERHPPTYLRG